MKLIKIKQRVIKLIQELGELKRANQAANIFKYYKQIDRIIIALPHLKLAMVLL